MDLTLSNGLMFQIFNIGLNTTSLPKMDAKDLLEKKLNKLNLLTPITPLKIYSKEFKKEKKLLINYMFKLWN